MVTKIHSLFPRHLFTPKPLAKPTTSHKREAQKPPVCSLSKKWYVIITTQEVCQPARYLFIYCGFPKRPITVVRCAFFLRQPALSALEELHCQHDHCHRNLCPHFCLRHWLASGPSEHVKVNLSSILKVFFTAAPSRRAPTPGTGDVLGGLPCSTSVVDGLTISTPL